MYRSCKFQLQMKFHQKNLRFATIDKVYFLFYQLLIFNISQMQKIYGNKFQQFSFKSIMISKIIILILIFLTSIFDKWCCSLIISSAASSHDNAWAKRKFGLLLPLIYIKYMVTVFKHKLYLYKGKKICQKARFAG